jgi:hypothetical protein
MGRRGRGVMPRVSQMDEEEEFEDDDFEDSWEEEDEDEY